MPFAKGRGCNIYYEVEGSGPLLVLQHGIFRDQAFWKDAGYVEALKDDFTVATVDSLGHGQSDRPAEAARYRAVERAGDIVAVIDALGADKAHVLGYSMGGWIAAGVARHFPDRLASLAIGGWDCVEGLKHFLQAAGIDESFDALLQICRQALPSDVMEWVTDDEIPGLAHCYEQLFDLNGSAQAVIELDAPVLLWAGEEDACYRPMFSFAKQHNFDFLPVPGDHAGAEVNGARHVAPALRRTLLTGE